MKIYASSPQGNAHSVMAAVRSLLREVGRKDEWPAIRDRMMGGDYANLCEVAKEVTYGSIEVIDDLSGEDDE